MDAEPEQDQLAVLKDIRDELRTLNQVFACANFQLIPQRLLEIAMNTVKADAREDEAT